MSKETSNLPVIVVGAGPAGLVAASILKKNGVRFVIVEKAPRERICANAGSGFELQKTAVNILQNELGVDAETIMHEYAGSMCLSMDGGALVRDMCVKPDGNDAWHVSTVNRADLQNVLLKQLFPTPEDEVGVLKCGAAFESYVEDVSNGHVVVTLADDKSTTLTGCALLACDGYNSKVRQCMHGDENEDPFNFLGTLTYWAKCPIVDGSDMQKELDKTQTYKDTKGSSMVLGMGTSNAPGCLYLCQSKHDLIWALSLPSKDPPKMSGDLTGRGGKVLDDTEKQALFNKMEPYHFTLMNKIIEVTPASSITEAGLFDRQNLDLSYSGPGNLVVLLGDAAHPQSPVLGQGANMAISDAYVVATRIAQQYKQQQNVDIPSIVVKFDTLKRRKEVNSIIERARFYTTLMVTDSWIMTKLYWLMVKFVPVGMLISEGVGLDQSNHDMVQEMQKELKINE